MIIQYQNSVLILTDGKVFNCTLIIQYQTLVPIIIMLILIDGKGQWYLNCLLFVDCFVNLLLTLMSLFEIIIAKQNNYMQT